MKPSQFHSNRQLHNWLVYNIGDRFLEQAIPHYKGIMYDLGCGEAPYKSFFLQYADQYVGVDWEGSMHNTIPDIVADLNELLPIDSEVADTVISLSVMEHLREPQTMLNEAYRILKPGGVMILQVPFQWMVHESPYDFFRYTPYGLEYLLKKARFIDITVTPQSGYFTMLIMKMNYFSLRFVRGPILLRLSIKALLVPFWTLGQLVAPLLDKLDRNWAEETTGFLVTAKKVWV